MSNKKLRRAVHQRPTFTELISTFADIPADVTDGMRLEMRGRNELLLYGCREIYEYSRERIRILQGRCAVCVCGRRLTMTSYSCGRVAVKGEIDLIDFCGGLESEEYKERV